MNGPQHYSWERFVEDLGYSGETAKEVTERNKIIDIMKKDI